MLTCKRNKQSQIHKSRSVKKCTTIISEIMKQRSHLHKLKIHLTKPMKPECKRCDAG